ncbi:Ger(x)C family spore germination protein [Jeotgalibacillus marinus]|uniref:Ger(X)C family spore germination protein n=1 Tax=Jeotgalibacillus marinus TaxID=86667 RepID=A0ABV3Q2L7_9BACL
MNRSFLLTLSFSVLMITGCAGETRDTSVEHVALVSVMGIDYIDEKNMKLTVAIPVPTGESTAENTKDTQIFSTETKLMQEGIIDISSQADKRIKLNGLEVIMFDQKFAESGKMLSVLENLYRDPTVGGHVRIVVVKGSSEKVLTADYTEEPSIISYLITLMRPQINNTYGPFTTIHEFMYAQTNPVLDTLIPYLEKEESLPKVAGMALIDSNSKEMIQKFNLEQGKLIHSLQGTREIPPFSFNLSENSSEEERVVIDLITSKSKIKGNKNINDPHLTVELKFNGALTEYLGDKDLSNGEDFAKLEKQIGEHLENHTIDLLNELSDLRADPVGFSEKFRMYYDGEWTEDLTEQIVSTAQFDVTVEMKILNVGSLK